MCWNAINEARPYDGILLRVNTSALHRTLAANVVFMIAVLFAAFAHADDRHKRDSKKERRNIHEKLVDGIERRGKAHREVRRAVAKSLGIIEARERGCDPYQNYGRRIYLRPRGSHGYDRRYGDTYRCEARFNRYWQPYCTHPGHRHGHHRWSDEMFAGFEFPHLIVVLNNRAFCLKRDHGRYHGYGCRYIHETDYYRSWRSRDIIERSHDVWDAAAGGYSIYDEYPGTYEESEIIVDEDNPLDLRPRDTGPIYEQRPEAKWGPVANRTWDGKEAVCREHSTARCVIVLKPIEGRLTELVKPMIGPDDKLHTAYCSEGSCR